MNDIKLEIIYNEPEGVYNAHRADHITVSAMCDYNDCARTYKAVKDGEIVKDKSSVFGFGSSFHSMVLQLEVFRRDYRISGPLNPNTNKPYGPESKKYKDHVSDWAKYKNITCVHPDDYKIIKAMDKALKGHKLISSLLSQESQAEVTIRGTINDVKVQSRLDWLSVGILADLKSCADIDKFKSDCWKFKYFFKMGFYQNMARWAGLEIDTVCLIAVEKKQPYRCGLFEISDHPEMKTDEEYIENLMLMSEDAECNDKYQQSINLTTIENERREKWRN